MSDEPFEQAWLFLKAQNPDKPTDYETDIVHTDPAGFVYPLTRHSDQWGYRAGMRRREWSPDNEINEFQRELDPPPQTEKGQERELATWRRIVGPAFGRVKPSKSLPYTRFPSRPRTEMRTNHFNIHHRLSGPMAGSATLPPPPGSVQAQIDAKLELEGKPQTGRGRMIDSLVGVRDKRIDDTPIPFDFFEAVNDHLDGTHPIHPDDMTPELQRIINQQQSKFVQ